MEKLRGITSFKDGCWYIIPMNDSSKFFEESNKIPLFEFDTKFAEYIKSLRGKLGFTAVYFVEFEVHETKDGVVAKIIHPDDILDKISYSLQDMLDIAKYGFDYHTNSMHGGFIPDGNIKQHLFAKFGIV